MRPDPTAMSYTTSATSRPKTNPEVVDFSSVEAKSQPVAVQDNEKHRTAVVAKVRSTIQAKRKPVFATCLRLQLPQTAVGETCDPVVVLDRKWTALEASNSRQVESAHNSVDLQEMAVRNRDPVHACREQAY